MGKEILDAKNYTDRTYFLIVISAKKKDSLDVKIQDLLNWLKETSSVSLSDIEYTLLKGRSHYKYRFATVVESINELNHVLSDYLTGNEVKCYISNCMDTETDIHGNVQGNFSTEKLCLLELAKEYISGKDVRHKLDMLENCNRLALPTYPFHEKNYWIEKEEIEESLDISSFFNLKNIETLDENKKMYTKKVHRNSFYLKDHVVGNSLILPGVLYLEMGKVVADLLCPEGANVFTDIQFLKPLKFDENDETYEICMRTEKNKSVYDFIISDKDNDKIVYQRGCFYTDKTRKTDSCIDVEVIKKRCKKNITANECYENISERGLNLGKSFRAIQKVYIDKAATEALALISLPNHLLDTYENYKLHPSIIDGALENVANLTKSNKTLTLPHSIESINIYHKLEKECYSYVKYSESDKKDANQVKFDVIIISLKGKILMEIKGFTFMASEQNEVNKLSYFVNTWRPKALENSSLFQGTILYIGGNDTIWNTFHNKYENSILIYDEAFKNINKDVRYIINSQKKSVCHKTFEDISSMDVNISHIIIGWGVYLNILDYKELFSSLLNIVQAALIVFKRIKFAFCYSQEFGNLYYKSVVGFAKSLNIEKGENLFKVIEFDKDTEDIPSKVLCEINSSEDQEVRFYKNVRNVQCIKQVLKRNYNYDSLYTSGVYLIFGGNGHIGRVLVKEFCNLQNSTIILIGKSIENENITQFINSLRSNGNQVYYYSVDLTRKKDVNSLIVNIKKEYGNIKGIIHCAGIAHDSLVLNKDSKIANEVISAKIDSINNIDEALKDEDLDFFITTSSLASIIGNAGQCDYAFANCYLNSFAKNRNGMVNKGLRHGKTKSIIWPLWLEGGIKISEQMKAYMMNSLGIEALEDIEGVESFNYVNSCDYDEVIVMKGELKKIKISLGISDIKGISEEKPVKPDEWTVKDGIANIISEMLKIPLEDLDVSNNIMDFGFNSISIIELTDKINIKFGLSLKPSIYYQYNSIKRLANYISTEYQVATQDKKYDSSTEDSNKNTFSKNQNRDRSEKDIAIIGMYGKFPGAEDLEEYWKNLVEEKDCISNIPMERWNTKDFNDKLIENNQTPIYDKGGFINNIDKFDANFFEISPREATLMDPQQRILLENIWNTIEDSGHRISDYSDTNTGIFIGVATSDYTDVLRAYDKPIEAFTSTGASHCILCNRISYFFNWHGPSEPIDTACSSSLVAIHRAVQSIQNGDCDQAIAGGINIISSPLLFMAFGMAKMLSPDGQCKTFDKEANGYVRGEGVGTILLKPLQKAEEDGDHIYGVIKGTAINHGGRGNTLTAPSPELQANVIKRAYERAGFKSNTVGYIEAHGTGTKLGDPVEIEGLKLALKNGTEANTSITGNCYIGTVKTNIGHLEAAAGIAGIIKVLLSMKNRILPGNVHFKELNPYIDIEDTPFKILKHSCTWKHLEDDNGEIIPYRAGVSSFGFGGTNAHIALEEYKTNGKTIEEHDASERLIILSAKTESALLMRVKTLINYLTSEESKDATLKEIAYTLQIGREEFEERIGLYVHSKNELLEELMLYINKKPSIVKKGRCKTSKRHWLEKRKILNNKPLVKYKELLELYLNGNVIDWYLLYDEENINRIKLPGYSFEKISFWPSSSLPDFTRVFLNSSHIMTKINRTGKKTCNASSELTEVADSEMPQQRLEVYLKSIFHEICKIEPNNIKKNMHFEQLGLESFMITELNERLAKDFQDLDRTIFFEYQTLDELIDYFMREKSEELSKLFNVQQIAKNESDLERNRVDDKNSFNMQYDDIAIIGINGKYPEADNLEEFWKILKDGKDCIKEIPIERWDYKKYYSDKKHITNKINSKWGGFISDIDKFDPLFFRITPKDAEHIDPQERIFLENVYGTLEDAGYCYQSNKAQKTGVFVGVIHGHYQFLAVEETLKGNLTSLYSSFASIANRVSYFFNFKGPSMAVDTMCSSSLTAIHLACESIKRGECDMAIAGGVNLNIHPDKYIFLSQQRFTSSEGKCKAFGDGGDGYVPGEGVGSILLKPFSKAVKDGDNIYAVIKASAINHGGRTNGYSVSNPNAQADVIEETLLKSNINPRTINYVEAHGTGTELGDPIEIRGLTKAYEKYTKDKKFCRIGSVKTNIGHCEAAAGIASLTKVILQMKYKKLVPSLHSESLNKNINFDNSPFEVQHKLEDWEPVSIISEKGRKKYPLRAGISSFGAGGSNVHIILENYDNEDNNSTLDLQDEYELFIFSARNMKTLKILMKKYLNFFSYETSNHIGNIKAICINQVSKILKIDNCEVATDVPFEEYGFDKFAYNKLYACINSFCGVHFSEQELFINNTIDLLVDRIEQEYAKKKENRKVSIKNIAYTLMTGRWHHNEVRIAFKAKSMKEFLSNVESFIYGKQVNNIICSNNEGLKDIEHSFSEKELQEIIDSHDIDQIAKLWCMGCNFKFNSLFKDKECRKISLPLYPFEKKVIWFCPTQPVEETHKELNKLQILKDLEAGIINLEEAEYLMEDLNE